MSKSKNPSHRGARSAGLLLTCALSFIISSIPLGVLLFVHNPHITKEQVDSFATPEIPNEMVIDDAQHREFVQQAEEQRNDLVNQLKLMHAENVKLREELGEVIKHSTTAQQGCEMKLARAQHGFDESYRRFEIVQGYFDKCKDQTRRLGQILVDAETEIKNLTMKLIRCNILNNKMEVCC